MDSTTLAKERYLSITTFKRDGTAVSTPVWVAGENGTLLVWSAAGSWKVKRIRRDGHVRVAPCNAWGTVRGPALDGDATIVDETAAVSTLLARKYRLLYRAVGVLNAMVRRVRGRAPEPSVTIRIRPR